MKQIRWSEIKDYVGSNLTVINGNGKSKTFPIIKYVNGMVITNIGRGETYIPFNPEDENESTIKVFVN